jgi:hypothetical protein
MAVKTPSAGSRKTGLESTLFGIMMKISDMWTITVIRMQLIVRMMVAQGLSKMLRHSK